MGHATCHAPEHPRNRTLDRLSASKEGHGSGTVQSGLRTLRSFFRSVLTGKRVYVEVGLADGKVWGRLGEDGDGDEYELGSERVAASDILALHFTPGPWTH